MAIEKLYPPIIAGTTLPFYENEEGTYILQVPFSMNKMVSRNLISGFKVRIKRADNDIELGRLDAYWYSETKALFNLNPISAALRIGDYYKFQLAYIDLTGEVGYYSTISITKCTALPTIRIAGLSNSTTNKNTTRYLGEYKNIADPTEKCYQYKFTLFNGESEIVETTDWLIHNSNTNTDNISSQDEYILNYGLDTNNKYYLQYAVITNNGLQITSPYYEIMENIYIAPFAEVEFIMDLDYDNGCVNLGVREQYPKSANAAMTYYGTFILSRASVDTNYKTWTNLTYFTLNGELPTKAIYTDFTVEHGKTYRYAIQQFNDNQVYSSRLLAIEKYAQGNVDIIKNTELYVGFEDMYLYDGIRQLRIQFNPKVSSFKTVLQETKKNTLGSKFPFFFTNEIINYKEFSISGLISYLMDINHYFLSVEELNMPINWDYTTDIIDENIFFERKFKMSVLDWLNNGEVKLFRSPAEGNYLVRLSGVSLSPTDSVSRMLHTFTATADEIDDCTEDKLAFYKIINLDVSTSYVLNFETLNLNDIFQTIRDEVGEDLLLAQSIFRSTDLLKGYQAQYISFSNCNSLLPFALDDKNYFCNRNGSQTLTFVDPAEVLNVLIPLDGSTSFIPGQVTIGILSPLSGIFKLIQKIESHDIIDAPSASKGKDNYIDSITNVKERIDKFYYMKFNYNSSLSSTGTQPTITIGSGRAATTITLTSKQICINNEIYTLNDSLSTLVIPIKTKIDRIYWGTQIEPLFIYSLCYTEYDFENTTETMPNDSLSFKTGKLNAELNQKNYIASILGFVKGSVSNAKQTIVGEYDEMSYFIWTGQYFKKLTREERTSFNGNEVWCPYIPNSYSSTLTNPTVYSPHNASNKINYYEKVQIKLDTYGVTILYDNDQ